MIKFIKRLFNREPDVMLIGSSDDDRIKFVRSRIIGGRRVVEDCGYMAILESDGSIRGNMWFKKWEAL